MFCDSFTDNRNIFAGKFVDPHASTQGDQMKRSLARFSSLLLVGLLMTAAVRAQDASAAKEWNVNNTSQISYGEPYELYDKTSQIGYGERTFGVNLDWVGHSGGTFEFRRQAPANTTDHRKGPIGPTENVSIYNSKSQKYLVYQIRGDTEAELGWSGAPSYEWQIQAQTPSSGRVYFALYNTKVKKYLVYQVKNYGINLGWLSGPGGETRSFSVAMSAQQVVNGWVPYLGSMAGPGHLLSVQNASQTATLLFIKPGKSTTDCSDPMATVAVGPRASMTADQMKTLYGSASPPLPVNFLACLTTPTPASISLTFLNITYRTN